MPTHLSRKELKQDNVALKVEETTHFLVTHRPLVVRAGAVALAVLVIGLASWFFIGSRHDAREQALAAALALENVPVGSAPPGGGQSFPSESAKNDAIAKAFNSIIAQNGGGSAYAAGLARAYNGGGYGDWYLPSLVELSYLYTNRALIGGFVNAPYWSSSEGDGYDAWLLNFANGSQADYLKSLVNGVRAVRSF